MFCKKVELPFDLVNQKIIFICNAVKLNIEDEKTLAQIIRSSYLPTIVALDVNNIIGA